MAAAAPASSGVHVGFWLDVKAVTDGYEMERVCRRVWCAAAEQIRRGHAAPDTATYDAHGRS